MLRVPDRDDLFNVLLILVALALGTAVAMVPVVAGVTQVQTHNEQGGYIDACGDLPGLLGDDC